MITQNKFPYRALLKRSAMRVCHPGPVDFQRSMTSAGSLSVISFLGFSERGLPPFFAVARSSMSVVSSGRSRYSFAAITCASTRFKSDFKIRPEALFLAVICFPHAEDMSTCAARHIAHNNQATRQVAIADHSDFTIVLSRIFDLNGCAPENQARVFEIESALDQRSQALGRIVGDAH